MPKLVKTAAAPKTTLRARALVVQIAIEEVDGGGNVTGETLTEAKVLFPKFWGDIPNLVKSAIEKANLERLAPEFAVKRDSK